MLSNGHTLSSTFRCYHLILMTIKTFLMSLFYPNFSYHLMSDQIISPHFFPADPSSALRSPWRPVFRLRLCRSIAISGSSQPGRCQTCIELEPHEAWAVTTQITQSQARSPGPGLIKTLHRRRGCVTLYMCTVYMCTVWTGRCGINYRIMKRELWVKSIEYSKYNSKCHFECQIKARYFIHENGSW